LISKLFLFYLDKSFINNLMKHKLIDK